jgi:RNA polymerase-binding transcription factor DksA
MAGYEGNPDAAAQAAQEHLENLIQASSDHLKGPVLKQCADCGDDINPARVEAAIAGGRACKYCIECQPYHDKARSVRMLDHIL